LKSTFSAQQFPFVYLLLPPKHANWRKIPRKFELTAVQGHPRSMILVPIESAYATSYLSPIVTMVLSCTVSEILQLIGW